VEQKKKGGNCKRVEDMTIGWGFDHVQLKRLVEWKGEKVLHVHNQRGLGKCRVEASHSHKKVGG